MSYKLRIIMTVEPIFEGAAKLFYKRVLNTKDVVRGVPFNLILQAENIGNKEFPGGKQNVTILYTGAYSSEMPSKDIPSIDVDEQKTIFQAKFVPLNEGSASIDTKIKAKDEEKVECYQHRTDRPLRVDAWTDVFYVINFEHAVMMMQLERISDLIERARK